DAPVGDVAGEMAGAIVTYGMPFMDERASLSAVVTSMADGRAGCWRPRCLHTTRQRSVLMCRQVLVESPTVAQVDGCAGRLGC
ncbi:MAG: hypothetical protein WBH47_07820, partial [Streptosporangiaceae bacterium]